MVRFRYELRSTAERRLTKIAGVDTIRLAAVRLPTRRAAEVRLSDYNSLVHSYVLLRCYRDFVLTVANPSWSWRRCPGSLRSCC